MYVLLKSFLCETQRQNFFFFVLSTSILFAKVILNKENTIEIIKNIKDIRVLADKITVFLIKYDLKSTQLYFVLK